MTIYITTKNSLEWNFDIFTQVASELYRDYKKVGGVLI
jgi:hypothetical protein